MTDGKDEEEIRDISPQELAAHIARLLLSKYGDPRIATADVKDNTVTVLPFDSDDAFDVMVTKRKGQGHGDEP